MQRYTLAAVAVLLVLFPAQRALQADQTLYTIQDLGQTADGRTPTVTGLNAKGQLSGYVWLEDFSATRAVRFTDGFGWQYLPGLDTMYSVATGINTYGDLVGYRLVGSQFVAFRYRDGSGVEDILPLAGNGASFGYAINDNGVVVGESDSTFESVGFRADPQLPAQQVRPFAKLCAINNDGTVVGYGAAPPPGNLHSYRLDTAGNLTDVSGFDGPESFSIACALDENGRFGGQAAQGVSTRAFAYTSNGMVNLDVFASPLSGTQAIAAGRSVGYYYREDFTQRAFMHTDETGSVDLNSVLPADSGWELLSADGVNAAGQIVGSALKNGVATTYRLTPAAATHDTTPPVFTSLTATPSIIFPPKGQKVTVTVSGEATDDSGVMPVCKLTSVTGPGAAGVDFEVTGANTASVAAVGGRTYSMNVTCVDASDNAASQSVDVFVKPDTTAPVIASVTATPSTIWPPDGNMKPVTVNVTASDDVDDQPLCYLSDVTAAGAAAGDSVIRGTFSADVRAVGGRTYAMNVSCSDRAGNHSARSVNVVVPPDTTAPVITELSVTPNAIWPPDGSMKAVTVSVTASDDVDNQPRCYLSGVTSAGAATGDAVIRGTFSADVRAVGGRTYAMNVSCSDSAGNQSARSVNVVVPPDTTAPVITELSVTPNVIWPPNGKMVPVQVSVSATDDVDAAPSCALSSISGSSADSVITGAFTANVRALKSGDDSDRAYVLTVTCSDRAKNKSSRTVNVVVTKNDPSMNYSGKPGKGNSGK
ncbi:MAG TPA: hypothetical protein VN716_00155 [Vicinamibacterales bacterium]|nr:hypothetical protein [Vicinamibacterales bacterium]